MKIIRGIHNLNQVPYGCVLTIGNFDGVHLGHQKLLHNLYTESKKRRLPVVVIIFEPHPLELFAGIKAPARLTCLREKLYYLSKYGIDYLLCIHFNRHFATLTAQDFISDLLVKRLGMRFITVGDDFRFGTGRKGDLLLLKMEGIKYGFDVASMPIFYKEDLRVSSTAIRAALAQDNLQMAENLLGHPFVISGRVIHGDGLGRMIGFPTANIPLRRKVSPVKGVYAVEVIIMTNKCLLGVANIGTRPTVSGRYQQLEVHLFDVFIDLYGCYIDVILRKKIRNEQRFSSLNELKDQIEKNELTTRKFFKSSKL